MIQTDGNIEIFLYDGSNINEIVSRYKLTFISEYCGHPYLKNKNGKWVANVIPNYYLATYDRGKTFLLVDAKYFKSRLEPNKDVSENIEKMIKDVEDDVRMLYTKDDVIKLLKKRLK